MGKDSLWVVPNSMGLYTLVNGRLRKLQTSNGFYPVINKIFGQAQDVMHWLMGSLQI